MAICYFKNCLTLGRVIHVWAIRFEGLIFKISAHLEDVNVLVVNGTSHSLDHCNQPVDCFNVVQSSCEKISVK